MWQFLKALHGRYRSGLLGYEAYDDENQDVSKMKLDPISVAGACNIPKLRIIVGPYAFAELAVGIISNPEVFKRIVQPPMIQDPMEERATAEKWKSHLDSLEKTTPIPILAEICVGEVLGVSTYFAVPKSEDEARAIFNGRHFSLGCNAPPTTNLPDITSLLECMSQVTGRSVTMVEGDIRHFFHQLQLNDTIARHFCVRRGAGKRSFRKWCTLPMGWSFFSLYRSEHFNGHSLEHFGEVQDRCRPLQAPVDTATVHSHRKPKQGGYPCRSCLVR
jgi:hypothetical protein